MYSRAYCTQNWILGFPWWCSGCGSACQCRGHGFDPWSGRIPHAAGQRSPCATAEPALWSPWAAAAGPMCHGCWSPRATTAGACAPGARAPQRERPPQWEAWAPRWRVPLLAAAEGGPRVATEAAKKKKRLFQKKTGSYCMYCLVISFSLSSTLESLSSFLR